MTKLTSHWYTSWFNTPYYHQLYKDRDYAEAQLFMDNLTGYLSLPKGSHILDLACGRGRHSIYLNQLGFRVTGVDLSEESIAVAKAHENETLRFEVHDMTVPYPETFDAVFNLFTSFGYFEDDDCNLKTLKSIKTELKPKGFGVIDFMNSDYVIDHLVAEDVKQVDGISFQQKRRFEDGYIIKDIEFDADEQSYHFQERVKALTLEDFTTLFNEAGIELLEVFGNYKLQGFDRKHSERLIMIFK